jgi:hypothetical protein
MRDEAGKWFKLLGVQEAVGSNPAVPTFKIKNLRALTRRPFPFGATFGATFKSNSVPSRDHQEEASFRCRWKCV